MMTTFFAMALFSLSMSISPGPVNTIALSCGANYGFRRAITFVSGATLGFTLLLFIVGLGLGSIALESRIFLNALTVAGALFIAYMGFKSLTASAAVTPSEDTAPSFYNGLALQWMNPKAWIACVSGVSAFGASTLPTLALFVSIYFFICYLSIAAWALLGGQMHGLLTHNRYRHYFNLTVGSSLILVAIYLIQQQLFSAS